MSAKAQNAPHLPGSDTEFLSRHSSRVLIQEVSTRRYFSRSGLWTAEPDLALTFSSGSAAMEHLKQRKLTNVQLVLTRAITISKVIPVTKDLQG